ncbi:MAG: RDD family protein [Clostridia bacterium]|nr:RDD family protein [Clostridia bacterium]
MIYDLQKANMWKRISAYIFDMILLVIITVGIASLLSLILGYDSYSERLQECYGKYEELYGVDFDLTAEEYDALSAEELSNYEAAAEALAADGEANYVYSMIFNLTLLIVTFSILIAYLLLEFTVPLLFKNGQTLGKKVFGVAVMRLDGVKVNAPLLFIRTILGKYTVETMIPVLIVIMLLFNVITVVGIAVIALILLVQAVLVIATRTRSPIHDMIASTVAVDMASQLIFDSKEDMLEYKKRIHAEAAAKQEY